MFILYRILGYVCMPILFFRLWWRSRDMPIRWERWQERCGYAPLMQDCIWIHAVSLGETIAAIPLIKKVKESYPDYPILVSNMTLTGSQQVAQQLGHIVNNVYIPFDVSHFVKRFFNRTKPKLAILFETELWPCLFHECNLRKIPILVLNARLSEKSARLYQRYFSSMMRCMMHSVAFLAAQSQADGQRFIELGLSKEKLIIAGNIKFDMSFSQDQLEKGIFLKKALGSRLVWIAASTHDSEEKIMLNAHKQLLHLYPDALLILVPRHPERFNEVADLLIQEGCSFSRRSSSELIPINTEVYLADTVGEMMIFYSASDIALVGGSFKAIGGHNVLEPAALAKPIITGPDFHNFTQAVNLLNRVGAICIVENNETSLVNTLILLAKDKSKRDFMGKQALKVINENKGALEKQFQLIQHFL